MAVMKLDNIWQRLKNSKNDAAEIMTSWLLLCNMGENPKTLGVTVLTMQPILLSLHGEWIFLNPQTF